MEKSNPKLAIRYWDEQHYKKQLFF